MSETEIKFVGRVLDNVHGFIYYTEAEEKIMQTALFKRLQSIKQLSIVNWIFPGSEHTRYIHSLGVMYIADKIAVKLNLSSIGNCSNTSADFCIILIALSKSPTRSYKCAFS